MHARRKFLGSSLALGAAFALFGHAAPAAHAHGPRGWRPPPPPPPLVSVSLVDGHGGSLPTVKHRGKTFVAGERGDRYEVIVRNNSNDRLEVVLSVDGRDAVSGRLANFRKARGYVLEPFGEVSIDGFRTSLDAVAAFRFTDPGDSFAGRNGTPQHTGVISVAVFKERRRPMKRHHHRPRAAAPRDDRAGADASRPGATGGAPRADSKSKDSRARKAPRVQQELGTRFGEHRHSRVREVAFTRARADRPDLVSTIRYDSAHALADRGVPIFREPVFTAPPPRHDGWPGAVDRRFTPPPPPRHR
ncbi:MAG: hypothetical protein AAF721_13430 [Myxococcota bacterium]